MVGPPVGVNGSGYFAGDHVAHAESDCHSALKKGLACPAGWRAGLTAGSRSEPGRPAGGAIPSDRGEGCVAGPGHEVVMASSSVRAEVFEGHGLFRGANVKSTRDAKGGALRTPRGQTRRKRFENGVL
jgi:hypothetical protein